MKTIRYVLSLVSLQDKGDEAEELKDRACIVIQSFTSVWRTTLRSKSLINIFYENHCHRNASLALISIRC